MRVEGRILPGEPEVSGAPDGVEHTRTRELGAGSPLRTEQLRGILRAQAGPGSVAAHDVVERVRAGAASSAWA